MESESKLVPILREAVEVVKMILFKQLQEHLLERFSKDDRPYVNRLAGAVINFLFGIDNPDPAYQDFVEKERARIDEVLGTLALDLEKLRIPLTDALRTVVLCDSLDGVDSTILLTKASDLGILLVDRDLPMPNKFIEMVRTLGKSYGILTPPVSAE